MASKSRSPEPRPTDRTTAAKSVVLGFEKLSPAAKTTLVFGTGLAVHVLSLLVSPLARTPVGLFFFGDSLNFLEQARRLAAGEALLNAGLPFHPPLVSYLLAPLWWLLSSADSAFFAAKILMAALAAAGYALFYRLVRERIPHAFWICLLLPFSFGELVLTSAVSSELIYRLLLLVILALGWRRPVLGGVAHGLACLARAEHLGFVLLLGACLAWKPERRRWVLRTLSGAALVLAPHIVSAQRVLSAYNLGHAAELASPLPEWVPVSFYGPLNFALAQREPTIFFGRETLPPAPDGSSALEPTFAPHHEVIVAGYGLGWEAIWRQPGRFFARSGAKLLHSLQGMTFGWTWRDWPKPAHWTRQPIDVAYSASFAWSLLCLCLTALGAWRLRSQKMFLGVVGLLLLYRLGINVLFFPYLRGVLIVAPALLALQWTGLASLAKTRGQGVLVGCWIVLVVFHFATLTSAASGYRLSGERREDGTLIDDRPVVIERYSGGATGASS